MDLRRPTVALLLALLPIVAAPALAKAPSSSPNLKELKRLKAQFVPVELKVDLTALPDSEKAALKKILQASKIMNTLFMRQVSPDNQTVLLDLLQDSSALGRARLDLFMLHRGPWDRVHGDRPFIPGVGPKPAEAGFYPAGADKAAMENYFKKISFGERSRAQSFYTTIRRGRGKSFIVVPYSVEYQGELAQAAQLLNEAAALTKQPSLKAFLNTRAEAFLNNHYAESEVAWMEIDAEIEPTIGPYEVYEDGWFNAKAAFEAVIGLRDDAETKKLAVFGASLQQLEDKLPIDPTWRNERLGDLAPIRVINEIYASGDADVGVKAAAYNLPNDEEVKAEKGSKHVMIKNVQQAKFDKVLVPIAKVALDAKDRKKVSFDAFFTHILMHELAHGLGPEDTKTDNSTTVREALKEHYSVIEEAKSDVLGLWALDQLARDEKVDPAIVRAMYPTFLASMFRSIRFGVGSAHGSAVAIQLNTFLDSGAVKVAANGTFSVDPDSMKLAVTKLSRQLMTLQAQGDYKGAKALIAKQGVVRPETQKVLDKLGKVPIDIAPVFVTAEKLLK